MKARQKIQCHNV